MANTPLKTRLNRFFYRNRDRGIPKLMIVLAAGNVLVYLSVLMNPDNLLFYNALRFDPTLILKGQVWRLISYPLTYLTEIGSILGILSLLFYVWAGWVLEDYWGILKFNCYVFAGILLTDAAALILQAYASANYIYLSLFLALATLMPDEQIRIWFILPVKMKWLALIDLGLSLIGVVSGIIAMISGLIRGAGLYLDWLLILAPIAVYFLFFGKQSAVLLPDFIRYHPTKKSWNRAVKTKTVYNKARIHTVDNARFRCTVCGRTELTNPGLEFRYCSRCAGYRCYCEDHINNHAHITE